MSSQRSLSGVVLAGGYSTRFGEDDKAVAELAGTPMIRRVADRLATVCDELVINCREDQREAIEAAMADFPDLVTFAVDPEPDRGPLAGIAVGLEAANREYGAVVACDMPFVDPALIEQLADRARDHDGALVKLEDGWYQTTQAVYRAEPMARACADVLEREDGRILAALEELDTVVVGEDELADVAEETFESIDTKAALREAAERFEARSRS
ncbi:molybdenum cofactor guanylyltransferase [Natronococcus occultus]|uniref:Probable molybdenum cofactor guanylyltransferase n=1 Tax=Natronococcus occultus SP4 TaxID=694430 RepID=L0K3A4_9EURY|nr:molybdenum cofactor guanylyltransferase [Natronococcus occultus]AGB39491.1 molybdopterin-guanine dinucleotide biosynthesis protein A [Natronococcus occultus SP4]